MQTITTTQLRTKTRHLVKSLIKGEKVDLIHRSKLIGEIKPKQVKVKRFDAKRFAKIVKDLNLPQLTYEEREKRYREAMVKKHGKPVS
jgi:hypothetical protein